MIKLFGENSLCLKVVNHFLRKAPSQIFNRVLNTPLMISSRFLQAQNIQRVRVSKKQPPEVCYKNRHKTPVPETVLKKRLCTGVFV